MSERRRELARLRNNDTGAVQLLMFGGKKQDVINKLQELVRPSKGGEY